MTKVWVVSALVVAAIAGGVLLLFAEDAPKDRDTTPKLKPPVSLREEEVRLYMKIRPIEDQIFVAAAIAFGTNKPIDAPLELARVLKRFHLTRDDWTTMRQRVEYVVGIQRYENNKDKRTAAIHKKLRKNEKLLESAENEALKQRIRGDIVFLKNKLRAVAKPISDSDRAVTQKFWTTLSKLVAAEQGP